MKKTYIAFILLLVFLAAVVADWNARQESDQKTGGVHMMRSRNDDILEIEIGYAGGKNPINKPSSPLETSGAAGTGTASSAVQNSKRTVLEINDDEPEPDRRGAQEHRGLSKYYIYEVKAGDTISEISLEFLGTSGRAQEIMTLNSIKDAKSIQPGMKLKIPRD